MNVTVATKWTLRFIRTLVRSYLRFDGISGHGFRQSWPFLGNSWESCRVDRIGVPHMRVVSTYLSGSFELPFNHDFMEPCLKCSGSLFILSTSWPGRIAQRRLKRNAKNRKFSLRILVGDWSLQFINNIFRRHLFHRVRRNSVSTGI